MNIEKLAKKDAKRLFEIVCDIEARVNLDSEYNQMVGEAYEALRAPVMLNPRRGSKTIAFAIGFSIGSVMVLYGIDEDIRHKVESIRQEVKKRLAR